MSIRKIFCTQIINTAVRNDRTGVSYTKYFLVQKYSFAQKASLEIGTIIESS